MKRQLFLSHSFHKPLFFTKDCNGKLSAVKYWWALELKIKQVHSQATGLVDVAIKVYFACTDVLF